MNDANDNLHSSEDDPNWILYEKDPATKIATLTLNRPDRLNAPTIGMRLRYGDYLHQANIDDDVKVLVIRGAGDDLGSGQDLPEFMEAVNSDDGLLREVMLEDADVVYPPKRNFRHGATATQWFTDPRGGCRTLQEFKKISIVEVKGYCYGWHFYQAGDADLVISSDDALFGHAAFRYAGAAPRMFWWATTMGLRKFQEMVFTGRPFTAAEMDELGFINSVVPRDQLEAETAKYAAGLRQQPPDRRGLHPEDVLRDRQAVPGRVHGQPDQRPARVVGHLRPARRPRGGPGHQRRHRSGADQGGEGLRPAVPTRVAAEQEGPRRLRVAALR